MTQIDELFNENDNIFRNDSYAKKFKYKICQTILKLIEDKEYLRQDKQDLEIQIRDLKTRHMEESMNTKNQFNNQINQLKNNIIKNEEEIQNLNIENQKQLLLLSKYDRKFELSESEINSDKLNKSNNLKYKSSQNQSKSRFNFSNDSKLSVDKSKSIERSWENFPVLQYSDGLPLESTLNIKNKNDILTGSNELYDMTFKVDNNRMSVDSYTDLGKSNNLSSSKFKNKKILKNSKSFQDLHDSNSFKNISNSYNEDKPDNYKLKDKQNSSNKSKNKSRPEFNSPRVDFKIEKIDFNCSFKENDDNKSNKNEVSILQDDNISENDQYKLQKEEYSNKKIAKIKDRKNYTNDKQYKFSDKHKFDDGTIKIKYDITTNRLRRIFTTKYLNSLLLCRNVNQIQVNKSYNDDDFNLMFKNFKKKYRKFKNNKNQDMKSVV